MSKNDITGDSLVNKPLSKQGEANWDVIFGKNSNNYLNVKTTSNVHVEINTKNVSASNMGTDQALKEGKYSRIDTIGQNGNDGDHYEYELNKSTGEVEKRFKDGIDKPNGEQFDE